MARSGILYAQVAQAATNLLAQDKNPTVDSVREALGSTGSKSTIAPLLKRWKNEHSGTIAENQAGIPPALLESIRTVYENLQADFQQKIDQFQQEQADILQAEAEKLAAKQAENALLNEENEKLQDTWQRTTAALSAAQIELQSTHLSLVKQQSENNGLQQRLNDRSNEVQALTQQLAQLRNQFEHFQTASAAQRMEERQSAENRTANLERDLKDAQQRLVAQQLLIRQHEGQIRHTQTENDALKSTIATNLEQLSETRNEREQLRQQCHERVLTIQAQSEKLEQMQRVLFDAKLSLASEENRCQLTAAQLKQVEKRYQQSEEHRFQLMQEQANLNAQILMHQKQEGDLDAKSHA